jgi:hypothetical protein
MAVSSAMDGLQESICDDASTGQQMITRTQVSGMFKVATSPGIKLQETQVKQITIIYKYLLFINVTLYIKQSY